MAIVKSFETHTHKETDTSTLWRTKLFRCLILDTLEIPVTPLPEYAVKPYRYRRQIFCDILRYSAVSADIRRYPPISPRLATPLPPVPLRARRAGDLFA